MILFQFLNLIFNLKQQKNNLNQLKLYQTLKKSNDWIHNLQLSLFFVKLQIFQISYLHQFTHYKKIFILVIYFSKIISNCIYYKKSMGGTLCTEVSHYRMPIDYKPCINKPNIYQSMFDHTYLVSYQKLVRDQKDIKIENDNFLFRKCNSQFIIAPKYFNIQQNGFCSLNNKISYFFTPFEWNLSQVYQFENIFQAYGAIVCCLQGAVVLTKKYGYFNLRQEMISFLEGKIKIWINQSITQNSLQYPASNQIQTFTSIVKVIDSKISKKCIQDYFQLITKYNSELSISENYKLKKSKIIRKGYFQDLFQNKISQKSSLENALYFVLKEASKIQQIKWKQSDDKIEKVSIIDNYQNKENQILSHGQILLTGKNHMQIENYSKQNNYKENVQNNQKSISKNNSFSNHTNFVNKSLNNQKENYESRVQKKKVCSTHMNTSAFSQMLDKNSHLFAPNCFEKDKIEGSIMNLNQYKISNNSVQQSNQNSHNRYYSTAESVKPLKLSLRKINGASFNSFNSMKKKSEHSIYQNSNSLISPTNQNFIFDQKVNSYPYPNDQGKITLSNHSQFNQISRRQTVYQKDFSLEKIKKQEERATIKTNSRKNSQNLSIYANQGINSNQSIQKQEKNMQFLQKANKTSTKQTQQHLKTSNDSYEHYAIPQQWKKRKNFANDDVSLPKKYLQKISQQNQTLITSQDRANRQKNKKESFCSPKKPKYLTSIETQEKQSAKNITYQFQESQKKQKNSQSCNNSSIKLINNDTCFLKKRPSIDANIISWTINNSDTKISVESKEEANNELKNSNVFSNQVTADRNSRNLIKNLNKTSKKSRFSHHLALTSTNNNNGHSNLVKTKGGRQSQKINALKRFNIEQFIQNENGQTFVVVKQKQLVQIMNKIKRVRLPFRKLTTIQSIPGTQDEQYSYIDQGDYRDEYDSQQQQVSNYQLQE